MFFLSGSTERYSGVLLRTSFHPTAPRTKAVGSILTDNAARSPQKVISISMNAQVIFPKKSSHGPARFLSLVLGFIRKNVVFCIALVLAIVSVFLVPPDGEYLSYFDFRTLTCLFCTLAVVCALKNIRFFTILARKIVKMTGSTRSAVLSLVYITFLGSMLIANDMALLTFLPLGYFVLTSTGKEKYMAFTFIMQNIAANLGGMLTPFGNPQNLYLYSRFSIPTGEFLSIMIFPFLLSVALITAICLLFVKKEPIAVTEEFPYTLPRTRTVVYLLLFAFSIVIVFRLIPYWIGLIVIPLSLLFLDRRALLQVDYCLLGTFVCFFLFAGNISRLGAVHDFFTEMLNKSVLFVSVGSCQFISNVPTAILLSRFTHDYRALLYGVNIGGTGTLIASLASLITFREYTGHNPGKAGSYVGLFSLFNFAFLLILTAFCYFLLKL